jgi:hypothetical protein
VNVTIQWKLAADGLWKKGQQFPHGFGDTIANANPLREIPNEAGGVALLGINPRQDRSMFIKPEQTIFHPSRHDGLAQLCRHLIRDVEVFLSRAGLLAGSASRAHVREPVYQRQHITPSIFVGHRDSSLNALGRTLEGRNGRCKRR